MNTLKNNDYPLFVTYYKTYIWILDTCEKLPRTIKFSLSERIIEIATQALELIIETIYSKNKIPLLQKLNLVYEKLRIFFRILFDKRYISEKQYLHISENIETCGKMTGGWIKQCNE